LREEGKPAASAMRLVGDLGPMTAAQAYVP
jgi:hypothetical protein